MINIRKSLALSFAERYSALLISAITLPILSRLLKPEDIGIFSVGVAVVGIAHMIRDFGIANYLIQEKELTQPRIAAAFAVALLSAWGLGAVLTLASGAIGAFYGRPGVQQVLLILALNFLIIPFGMIALSLLKREMNFAVLYRISLASALAHATVSVVLAFLGFGFRALAWASVAGNVTTAVMAYRHGRSYAWRIPHLGEWRRVCSFGLPASAGDLIRQLGASAPDLVIGRLLGLADVGLYSRANGLVSLFSEVIVTAVAPVAQSTLALRHREGTSVKAPFLEAMAHMTAVAWPFFIFIGLMGEPIVRVLFGKQWLGAVPLIEILSIAALVRSCAVLNTTLLQATGAIRIYLRIHLFLQPVTVGLIVLGAMYSLTMVAASLVIVAGFYVASTYSYVNRLVASSPSELFHAVWRSLVVALCCSIAPLAVRFTLMSTVRPWLCLVVAGSGALAGWLLAAFALRHPMAAELRAFTRAQGFAREPSA